MAAIFAGASRNISLIQRADNDKWTPSAEIIVKAVEVVSKYHGPKLVTDFEVKDYRIDFHSADALEDLISYLKEAAEELRRVQPHADHINAEEQKESKSATDSR